MPIIPGAIRKLRADKRKASVNSAVRDTYKKAVSLMRKKPSEKGLKAVFSRLDKAVKGKVIHKNKAARLKSRLALLVKGK